jgi:hypothetical protein
MICTYPGCGQQFTPAYRSIGNSELLLCPLSAAVVHRGGRNSEYRERGIASATVGALSELRAAADLLHRGYEVTGCRLRRGVSLRPVLPHSSIGRLCCGYSWQRQEMRHTHHIHPADLMSPDVFSQSVLVVGVIVILGLLFVVFEEVLRFESILVTILVKRGA